jgi:putative ABC transport system permease protein
MVVLIGLLVMVKELWLSVIRNLLRDRMSGMVQVAGLTIVITCSLLLFLNYQYHNSFDNYHPNAEDIYRVVSRINDGRSGYVWDVAPPPLAPALRKQLPQIKNAVRFRELGRTVFRKGNNSRVESGVYLTDPGVFAMFGYKLLAGDPETALRTPNSIVLTESMAATYFGRAGDAPGKVLELENGETFRVTGVMRDVPFNSHFRFDALVAGVGAHAFQGGWSNFGVITYLQLPSQCSRSSWYKTLDRIAEQESKILTDKLGIQVSYQLQGITTIHRATLFSGLYNVDKKQLWIFLMVVCIALSGVVVCLLFSGHGNAPDLRIYPGVMDPDTYKTHKRFLLLHLILESGIIVLVSLILSIPLLALILPIFNGMAGVYLSILQLMEPEVVTAMAAIVVFAAIGGAIYPLFHLSVRMVPPYDSKKEEVFVA